MSCSPFDLRDYVLGELAEAERRQMDVHLRGCGSCQEEMERLSVTQSALLALRDEEVPQRIGFVSDPVFEPSGPRRLWRAFWNSGPKLGFAGVAMLSAALVIFTFFRPLAPAPAVAPSVDTAKIEQQISNRVAAEMGKAVAASEAREEKKTAELLAAAEQRFQQQRKSDMANVAAALVYQQKRYNVLEQASYEREGTR